MLSLDAARALAPDASALKAAQGLVGPRKWSALGQDDHAVWGHCQGSGASPYQVMLDKSDWTAKCSCPSKKFPCKHSLALMLYGAQTPQDFPSASAPDPVTAWLAKRVAKAAKPVPSPDAPVKPVDAKAAAKRLAQRDDRMSQGVEELRRWLTDLAQEGLTAHQVRDMKTWEDRARRLNDAQLPGLARRLLDLGATALSDDAHGSGLLRGLGRLHVLLCAHALREQLSEQEKHDVDAALGVPQREDDIPADHRVQDLWVCHGVHVEEDERLQTRRAWLRGHQSRRWALVLAFAPLGRALPMGPLAGHAYAVTLGFFPSALPRRAALIDAGWTLAPSSDTPSSAGDLVPDHGVREALRRLAHEWAKQPWAERHPVAIRGHLATCVQGRPWLQDKHGESLPLVTSTVPATWWARTHGQPSTWFGEWDGQQLLVLSTLAIPAGEVE